MKFSQVALQKLLTFLQQSYLNVYENSLATTSNELVIKLTTLWTTRSSTSNFKWLRCNVRICTFGHVSSATIQISLRIRVVWSVFTVRMKKLCIQGCPKCAQWIFGLDCGKTQADLNLHWAHMSECTFSDVLYSCEFRGERRGEGYRNAQSSWRTGVHFV